MIGSISAVCTSATLSAEEVICVIAQAAPTPWIMIPRLETRLASQMRRNTACRSGAAMPSVGRRRRFGWSVMIGSVGLPVTGLIPFDLKVMPAKAPACPVAELLLAVLSHS
jgi:hypothetical protein